MGSEKQTFLAPAKINLCLHVQGKFENGYHDLVMLMQRVSLYDRLEIGLRVDGSFDFSCPGLSLAVGEENLALRAAKLLLAHAGSALGAEIALQKNIPVAAGLGGGSSDAATVLLALNQMAKLGLSSAELMEIGVRLGADVPFFILERAAWATGIGDRLEPEADLPAIYYLLVNPRVPVSTAWVYQNLRLTSPVDVAKLREFPRTAEGLVRLLCNDLERVTLAHYPVIQEVKQQLIAAGALGALMSGSGATVFGLFSEREQAEQLAVDLAEEFGWWTAVVDPLP